MDDLDSHFFYVAGCGSVEESHDWEFLKDAHEHVVVLDGGRSWLYEMLKVEVDNVGILMFGLDCSEKREYFLEDMQFQAKAGLHMPYVLLTILKFFKKKISAS